MSRSQVRRQTGKLDFGANDSGCNILHVDMDAFYAAVELRDHPELKGTPVVIAAQGNRGVVLTATYEARALGIHSAMPISRARRIAPEATFLAPHHEKYSEEAYVWDIFQEEYLKNAGITFYRIWSKEWWKDLNQAEQKLLVQIRDIIG